MKENLQSYSELPSVIRSWLEQHNISSDCTLEFAGSAGSQRVYTRITGGSETYLLMVSPENDPDFGRFVRLTRFYRSLDFPVPDLFCVADESFQALIEDLGKKTLYDSLIENSLDKDRLYSSVIGVLIDLQSRVSKHQAESKDISGRVLDRDALLWESGYFREYFLESFRGQTLPETLSEKLSREFARLADQVAGHPQSVIHRDFQSQNLMVVDNSIRVIDYQGSRRGSVYYDLASLLLDPYMNLPQDSIEKYFSEYHTRSGTAMSSDESYQCFLLAGTQRLLQALGAYCNLTFHKNLGQFEKYIEPATEKLCWVMDRAGLKNLNELLKPFL